MASSTALVSVKERPRSRGLVVSTAADRARAFRRARVHSIGVKALRLALPMLAIGLCGYYALSLKLAMGIGGVKMSAPPTLSADNLAMHNPEYEGFNKDGGKYIVSAKTARQDIRDRNAPIQLTAVTGKLLQPDRTVTNLKAKLGTFDNKQNTLELYDGIEIVSQTGMKATLSRATILTKESKVISREPVLVEMASGSVRAKAMTLDQKTKQVAFTDGVNTRLTPERKPSTGAAQPAAAGQRGFGNADTPVDIVSDRLDVDDAAKLAVFTGGVRAVQNDATLETAQLEVTYEGASVAGGRPEQAEKSAEASPGSKVKRIISRTPVVMTQGGDRVTGDSADFDTLGEVASIIGRVVMTSAADRSAKSDRADVDQRSDTVLLTGNVHVMQGKNELKGRRLWIDRKAGRAQLTSPAEPGTAQGKIATRLYQSDTTQQGQASARKAQAPAKAEADPASPFGSFKTDPSQPIDVEAVSLDVNDTSKTAIYRNDVRVVQGDFKMATVEMTAFYTGQMAVNVTPGRAPDPAIPKQQAQLNKIEARKGVTVTGKDGQTATGQWADFDTKANTVTLGGEVKLTQGQTVLRGNKLLIDLNSGESRLLTEGSQTSDRHPTNPYVPGSPGAPGTAGARATAPDAQGPFTLEASGRPRGVFYPMQLKAMNKKDGDAKPAAGASAPATQPAPPAQATGEQPARKRVQEPPNFTTSVFGSSSSNN